MKTLLFAIALLVAACTQTPAFAQYAKPTGYVLPQAAIPDYNVTVSVWGIDTGFVGKFVGIFELHADGRWYGCTHNMTPSSNFDAEVAAAGGADAWLKNTGVFILNHALAECYPPIPTTPGAPPPSADIIGLVNYLLQGYQFKAAGGVETLAAK